MLIYIRNGLYGYIPSWGGKSTWGIKASAIDDHSISSGAFDWLGSGKYTYLKLQRNLIYVVFT